MKKKPIIISAISITLVLSIIALLLCSCGKDVSDNDSEKTKRSKESTETVSENSESENSDKKDKLVFGTNAEFPPFEFINTDEGVIDTYDGIDMVIAKQIAEDNGCTPKIENIEFDSLLVALNNGNVDAVIAAMTINPERLEKVDFSIPYYKATQVIIVKKESSIKNASDMKGKNIGVIQGNTGELCLSELGYDYLPYKDGSECLLELENENIDAMVIDSQTAEKYVEKHSELVVIEDSDAFPEETYAIAVKKGNTKLLKKINKSLEKMIKNGTVSSIAAKYCG